VARAAVHGHPYRPMRPSATTAARTPPDLAYCASHRRRAACKTCVSQSCFACCLPPLLKNYCTAGKAPPATARPSSRRWELPRREGVTTFSGHSCIWHNEPRGSLAGTRAASTCHGSHRRVTPRCTSPPRPRFPAGLSAPVSVLLRILASGGNRVAMRTFGVLQRWRGQCCVAPVRHVLPSRLRPLSVPLHLTVLVEVDCCFSCICAAMKGASIHWGRLLGDTVVPLFTAARSPCDAAHPSSPSPPHCGYSTLRRSLAHTQAYRFLSHDGLSRRGAVRNLARWNTMDLQELPRTSKTFCMDENSLRQPICIDASLAS
jgi:hypothetical protein